MNELHTKGTPSRRTGSGFRIAVFAAALVVLAAAADLAWMTPGRATIPDGGDRVFAHQRAGAEDSGPRPADDGYFPAQFAPPAGEQAPHIQAF